PLRRTTGETGAGAGRTGSGAAGGARVRQAHALLPASRRAARWADRGSRSPLALGSPAARPAPALPVPRPGRGDGADLADRLLGVGGGMPAGAVLAEKAPEHAAAHAGGEPVCPATAGAGCRGRDRACAGADRL